MSNKTMVWLIIALVAVAAVLGWIWLTEFIPSAPPPVPAGSEQEAKLWKLEIERYKACLDRYRAGQEAVRILVVGVVVGLAAVIFPTLTTRNRERFERYRESRETYSRASTGALYLPERLAALEYAEAMKLINEVHEYKHIAETYDELKDQLSRRSGNKTRKQWRDNMWETLEKYTQVVSGDPDEWDGLDRKSRLARLELAREGLRRKKDYYT